jgi:SpoVK/Ycf46/Vps4 family AAA+-type ATPase
VAKLLGTAGASSSASFITLNSSEIVQAEVGTSEKLIVSAFVTARENAPSVIFIDEFQALFTERSSSGSSKLSSTLLQCMDDIKQWRKADLRAIENAAANLDKAAKSRVVVLGATNTPWMVDTAFLRPGRFDRIVHVGLPSEADRQQILRVHLSKMKLFGGKTSVEAHSQSLAQKTHGFSGADLSALCRAAAIRCLIEGLDAVEEKHFSEELSENTCGSSNTELVNLNKQWRPRRGKERSCREF